MVVLNIHRQVHALGHIKYGPEAAQQVICTIVVNDNDVDDAQIIPCMVFECLLVIIYWVLGIGAALFHVGYALCEKILPDLTGPDHTVLQIFKPLTCETYGQALIIMPRFPRGSRCTHVTRDFLFGSFPVLTTLASTPSRHPI